METETKPQKEQGVLESASLSPFSEHLSGPVQPREYFVRFHWYYLLSMKKDLFWEHPEQGGGYNEYFCLFIGYKIKVKSVVCGTLLSNTLKYNKLRS